MLNKKRYDIVILQETFWDDQCHQDAQHEWGGEVFSSLYAKDKRRGVSCLIPRDADIDTIKHRIDDEGRVVMLDVTMDQRPLTIIGVYAT